MAHSARAPLLHWTTLIPVLSVLMLPALWGRDLPILAVGLVNAA